MEGLEEEIENSWKEVDRLGSEDVWQDYMEDLEGIECESLDSLVDDSYLIQEVSQALGDFTSVPRPPRNSDYFESYREMEDVGEKHREKGRFLERCAEGHVEDTTRFLIGRDWSLSSLDEASERLEKIALAVRNLDSGGLGGVEERLEYVREMKRRHLGEAWEDRFRTEEFRRGYDDEYLRLRREFEELDSSDPDNLKGMKRLVRESQELVEKYKSIEDSEGANQSARLHEDIEDAHQRLEPVYSDRRAKRITIAALLVTGALGFFKGNYVRFHAERLFESGMEVVENASVKAGELESRLSDSFSSPISLPHKVTVAAAENPGVTKSLYFDISEKQGKLYDLERRSEVVSFPFTANFRHTPTGDFRVVGHGSGDDSPPIYGDAFLVLENGDEDFTISGTYSRLHQRAIQDGVLKTERDIVLKNEDMMEVYNAVVGGLEKSVVVVER